MTYGSGPRQCVGKTLAQKLLRVCVTVLFNTLLYKFIVLKECGRQLLAGYSWEMVDTADEKLNYKTLPVLRPVKDVQALFRKR